MGVSGGFALGLGAGDNEIVGDALEPIDLVGVTDAFTPQASIDVILIEIRFDKNHI